MRGGWCGGAGCGGGGAGRGRAGCEFEKKGRQNKPKLNLRID